MATITKAQLLEELARRSFYEDAEIERVRDGWQVTDTYAVDTDEELTWTYEGGMKFNRLPDAYAPLQESYSFATADFIGFWFDELLENMDDGERLEFAYLVATDGDVSWDDEVGGYVGDDGEPTEDYYAGWTVAAYKVA